MSTSVRLAAEPRVIKEKHLNLKFRFEQDGVELEAIYFNGAGLDLPKPPWDIAFLIDRSEYRGREQVNIVLQAVRKA